MMGYMDRDVFLGEISWRDDFRDVMRPSFGHTKNSRMEMVPWENKHPASVLPSQQLLRLQKALETFDGPIDGYGRGWGGFLWLMLAIEQPHLVNRLVLESPWLDPLAR